LNSNELFEEVEAIEILFSDKSTPRTFNPNEFKKTECLPFPQARSKTVSFDNFSLLNKFSIKNAASLSSRFLYKI
jgi:hypothetical protein